MYDPIDRQAAIDALRYAQHRFTVADEAGGMGTVKWSEDVIYFAAAERVLTELPPAQPEHDENDLDFVQTHKRIPVQLVVSSDCISRQAAIDALDVLCQEHRYRIPGKRETYSPYNEAWQDALDRAEGAIGNLPPAQPEIIHCRDCTYYQTRQKSNFFPMCCLMNVIRDADDFCSRAERRTDERPD